MIVISNEIYKYFQFGRDFIIEPLLYFWISGQEKNGIVQRRASRVKASQQQQSRLNMVNVILVIYLAIYMDRVIQPGR